VVSISGKTFRVIEIAVAQLNGHGLNVERYSIVADELEPEIALEVTGARRKMILVTFQPWIQPQTFSASLLLYMSLTDATAGSLQLRPTRHPAPTRQLRRRPASGGRGARKSTPPFPPADQALGASGPA
jgi:hypothetical protein